MDKPDLRNRESVIAIRPERVLIGNRLPEDIPNKLEGRVEIVVFKESSIEYRVSSEVENEIIVLFLTKVQQ